MKWVLANQSLRPTEPPLASADNEMQTPQNEQNNYLAPPELPIERKIHDNLVYASEDVFEPSVFVTRQWRDVIATFLRKFLRLIVAIYLVFIAMPHAIVESFPGAPCALPVVSEYYHHCTREPVRPRGPIIKPDFITLAQLQSRLEYVMEDSASSSLVAVDIKDSEMALRDLKTLVKHSSLNNRKALEKDLERFVQDAKIASGSLQRFGSRVWGAVDRIVSENEHTIVMLEGLSSQPSGGFIDGIINFSVSNSRETDATRQEKMGEYWLQSIDLMNNALRKLIHEAQANVGHLQILEERLNKIQDMTVAEEEKLRGEERALKQQWFPDEDKLESNSASLGLLQMVQDNRKNALNHVTGVLFKLEQMSNDLDDLREGVATPRIIADSSNVPIEAHIRNIRSSTERLVNGQTHMREIEDAYRQKKFASD